MTKYIMANINNSNKDKNSISIKQHGEVFTPSWTVNLMLDFIDYRGKDIIGKRVIEPSFGDGAILIEIVNRYIRACLDCSTMTVDEIIGSLETNIIGIELNETHYKSCIEKLDNLVEQELTLRNPSKKVQWNLILGNTLYEHTSLIGTADYVVGNPPYVKVHNISIEDKLFIKQRFSRIEGSYDLYLCFFELSIDLLKSNTGKLCLLTPNTFIKNKASSKFRNYIVRNTLITKLIDFKSRKIFENADTYVSITVIDKGVVNNTTLDVFEVGDNETGVVPTFKTGIAYSRLNDKSWGLHEMEFGSSVNDNNHHSTKLSDICNVQIGLQTSADDIFIINSYTIVNDSDTIVFTKNGVRYEVELDATRKCIKGSTYKGNIESQHDLIIFPYSFTDDDKVNKMDENYFSNSFPKAYSYLVAHKSMLENRSMEKTSEWFHYSRSQGLINSNKEKIICCTFVKDSVETHIVSGDYSVHSCAYLTLKDVNKDLMQIIEILQSPAFSSMVKSVGKDLRGGYNTISASMIKNYMI